MNIISYKILLNVYMHWLVLSPRRISSMHDQVLFDLYPTNVDNWASS
jgi:hypothetical protein